ncbi:glycosyltransferase family 4 protein [Methylacidimicrobium sp. B4]|uniref:glycosyltransferase family 4 protein n=1 Tax=Methylacidimicrobium sp. B4 TaxID=2796139 RepID=UPI001A8FA3B7|nr:glycosyltransferase family 4 protein [Methylacidimicrobium sp. B4]QSR85447.1 glycosyltransferase family 4 protein [Methylacidimicrobium sp. B4]
MSLVVTTPYRENSILAIARAADGESSLECFYTTLYFAGAQPWASRLPVFGRKIGAELGRRAFPGISASRIRTVASPEELLHVLARRMVGRKLPPVSNAMMYWVKKRFAQGVASRLPWQAADCLIGMYAASWESFREARRRGLLCCLNFVNSHPADQNRYLRELAGLRGAAHQELVPPWVARRVEAELEAADMVLVPSRFVAEQLRRRGVPEEAIEQIPYGVDLSAFHPIVRKPERGDSFVRCLYVGQMAHRKGIPLLLQTARSLVGMPIRFQLLGPVVSPEVLENLPENVEYEGAGLPERVAAQMRQADLFVLPTLEDACALVVLEAMASGLPVVTTTHAGSGEILEGGVEGFVVPAGDRAALREALIHLAEDPGLRRRMGEAARKKVEKAYSWETYGRRVLDALAKRKERPRSARSRGPIGAEPTS